jgi:hypothetical protein
VAVGALTWSAFVLFVLVSPSEALVPVVIVVGLLILGGRGRRSTWVNSGAQSCCSPANASSMSDSTPAAREECWDGGVHRVALNREQIEEYSLFRQQGKPNDARKVSAPAPSTHQPTTERN